MTLLRAYGITVSKRTEKIHYLSQGGATYLHDRVKCTTGSGVSMPDHHFQTAWLIPRNSTVRAPDRANNPGVSTPVVDAEGMAWQLGGSSCDYVIQWTDIRTIKTIDERDFCKDIQVKVLKEANLRIVPNSNLLVGSSLRANISRIFRLLWTNDIRPSYAECLIDLSTALKRIKNSSVVEQVIDSVTIEHLAIENIIASTIVINDVSVLDVGNLIAETPAVVSSITLRCAMSHISKIQISSIGSFRTQGPTQDWSVVATDILHLADELALLRRPLK